VEQQQQQNSSLQLQNPTDYRYSGEINFKKSSKFQLLSAPKIPNSKLLQALWKTQFAKPIIKFFRRELRHGEKRKLELCSYKTKVCLFPPPKKNSGIRRSYNSGGIVPISYLKILNSFPSSKKSHF